MDDMVAQGGAILRRYSYALEMLYEHQDHDWVVDTIPHVLVWISGDDQKAPPSAVFRLLFSPTSDAAPEALELTLTFRVDVLSQRDKDLRAKLTRLQSGRSVDRERVAEMAAYGLALVAVSVLLPGRRVVAMSKLSAPDFLFDATPGALRGVEVAGRSAGGFPALRAVHREKAPQLAAKPDVAEAHLSLWCVSPQVSELSMVKP